MTFQKEIELFINTASKRELTIFGKNLKKYCKTRYLMESGRELPSNRFGYLNKTNKTDAFLREHLKYAVSYVNSLYGGQVIYNITNIIKDIIL